MPKNMSNTKLEAAYHVMNRHPLYCILVSFIPTNYRHPINRHSIASPTFRPHSVDGLATTTRPSLDTNSWVDTSGRVPSIFHSHDIRLMTTLPPRCRLHYTRNVAIYCARRNYIIRCMLGVKRVLAKRLSEDLDPQDPLETLQPLLREWHCKTSLGPSMIVELRTDLPSVTMLS